MRCCRGRGSRSAPGRCAPAGPALRHHPEPGRAALTRATTCRARIRARFHSPVKWNPAALPSPSRTRRMWTLRLFAVAVAVLVAVSAASAQEKQASPREDAVGVIRELRRIVAPTGVERYEYLSIGGIRQFVSIRGQDRANPVLLVIHGGPGFPTSGIAWWATRGLEEYFIVVHWDQ